jgi:pimeloyl-ACP methyl ester carboxylesterase
MRRGVLYGLIALVVILLVAWFAGPRVAMDAAVTFDPVAIGDDPEAYLAQSEGRVPNIVDGLQKEIVWAYPASKARTPLSIVYVHGFSASKGEVRPLPDIVARELGANLFYTRLTGHGQDGPAMATASVKAWANDFAEAVAVGRAIGEEVIVMATSTGGGLTIWAAANQPELMDKVKALVLLSPNVGVRAAGA